MSVPDEIKVRTEALADVVRSLNNASVHDTKLAFIAGAAASQLASWLIRAGYPDDEL